MSTAGSGSGPPRPDDDPELPSVTPATSQSAAARATTGRNMTITLSMPQRELLDNNDVMEAFQTALEKEHVNVDVSTLHRYQITVVEGDPEAARRCLQSVVYTDRLIYRTDEESARSTLLDLLTRFRGKLAVVFGEGAADVAYLHSIRAEVMPFLEQLQFYMKQFPLPKFLFDYLRKHLQHFCVTFYSNFSHGSRVSLELMDTDPDKPYLLLKCAVDRSSEVESVLVKKLTLLHLMHTDVEACRGRYLLSSPTGQRQVKAVEDDRRCHVSVRLETERELLEATSPQGHVVSACQGDIAATDSRWVVLPLPDGETSWTSPSHRGILERGHLVPEASHYTSSLGVPPKQQVLTLQCQGLAAGQTLHIVYIPPPSDHRFQQLVRTAIVQVLQAAKNSRCGVAIPLALCGPTQSLVLTAVLLGAVVDCFRDGSLPPVVKLYLDPGLQGPQAIPDTFRSLGWTCRTMDENNSSMDRVEVVIGDIKDIQGDAVVNSTDPRLTHVKGQVSRLLLERAGRDMLTQCQTQYPEGLGEHAVAATDAANLTNFKHIFHVALPQTSWNLTDAQFLLSALRSRVEWCLGLASLKNLQSLVLPALATGTLGYPPEAEADTVLEATKEFFRQMPHSSLKRVTYVAYKGNPWVAKTLKSREALFRYYGSPGTNNENGNVLDYQIQAAAGDGIIKNVSAGAVKTELRDFIKTTKATSLQINMQTFDVEQVNNIISGIDNGLYYNRTVLFLLIVVESDVAFDQLCSKLFRYRCQTVDPGQLSSEPQNVRVATVDICGHTSDIDRAMKKLKETDIPDCYKQAESVSLHPSLHDPDLGSTLTRTPMSSAQAVSGAAAATGDNQAAPLQTLSIPMREFEQLNMDLPTFSRVVQAVGVRSFSFRGDHVQLRPDRGAQTAEDIITRIRQATNTAPPAPAAPTVPVAGAMGAAEYLGQSAGSVRIPSLILSVQAGSSHGQDMVVSGVGSLQAGLEGQQAGVGGQQAGVGDQQAGVGGQQARMGGQQARMGGQQAGVGGQQAGVGDQQAGVGGQQAGVGDQQAGVGGQQAGMGGQQAGVGGQQAGVGGQQAGVGDQQAGVGDQPTGIQGPDRENLKVEGWEYVE